jgi:dipeptidyl aminopeptidase/acylaminoacyl peptidase
MAPFFNRKIRWIRVLRLTILAVAVAVVILDAALSWIYVRALIWPICVGEHPRIPGARSAEEIYLRTVDGPQLRAWYYPSENSAAIITLGGTGGALGENLPLAGPLIAEGYGILQIDSRACANPPSTVTLGFLEADDARAGLAYLKSRPDVDPSRVGLYGFSMGGVAAIRAAARNPEIAGVVAEGGYYNLGGDIVEAGRSQPLSRRIFLFSIAGMFWLQTGINPWASSPIDDLPKLSPLPILLIYGENEVDASRAFEQFAAANEPKELWVVPGGSHGGNHLAAPEEYRRRVIHFFDNQLLPAPVE